MICSNCLFKIITNMTIEKYLNIFYVKNYYKYKDSFDNLNLADMYELLKQYDLFRVCIQQYLDIKMVFTNNDLNILPDEKTFFIDTSLIVISNFDKMQYMLYDQFIVFGILNIFSLNYMRYVNIVPVKLFYDNRFIENIKMNIDNIEYFFVKNFLFSVYDIVNLDYNIVIKNSLKLIQNNMRKFIDITDLVEKYEMIFIENKDNIANLLDQKSLFINELFNKFDLIAEADKNVLFVKFVYSNGILIQTCDLVFLQLLKNNNNQSFYSFLFENKCLYFIFSNQDIEFKRYTVDNFIQQKKIINEVLKDYKTLGVMPSLFINDYYKKYVFKYLYEKFKIQSIFILPKYDKTQRELFDIIQENISNLQNKNLIINGFEIMYFFNEYDNRFPLFFMCKSICHYYILMFFKNLYVIDLLTNEKNGVYLPDKTIYQIYNYAYSGYEHGIQGEGNICYFYNFILMRYYANFNFDELFIFAIDKKKYCPQRYIFLADSMKTFSQYNIEDEEDLFVSDVENYKMIILPPLIILEYSQSVKYINDLLNWISINKNELYQKDIKELNNYIEQVEVIREGIILEKEKYKYAIKIKEYSYRMLNDFIDYVIENDLVRRDFLDDSKLNNLF